MNTTMSKTTKLALVSLMTAGVTMMLSAAWGGILGSKHDLGTGGAGQGAGGTGEVCVFCHTPHGSNTGAAVPLWNKALPSAGSFTRYSSLGTSSLDGSEAPVGSVSLACLSCHDGSQAMDVMINKPGSGGYNVGGSRFGATGDGKMTGAPMPMLGTDLSNDHPISIQYAGGGYTVAGGTPKDAGFVAPTKATLNASTAWWVDTAGGTAGRDKTDMMLYSRNVTEVAGGLQPFVECGSCHDPHNASTASATQVAFLRMSNDNSAVCLACHDK